MKSNSFRRRLLSAILVTSTTALAMTVLIFLLYEFSSYRHATARNLSTLARTVAANSAGALAFEDEDVAREILSGLKSEPSILGACVFNRSNKVFTTWSSTSPPRNLPITPQADGVRFVGRELLVFEPIVQADARLGTLFVIQDLRGYYKRAITYAGFGLVVLAAAAVFAFLMARYFERRLTEPVLALASTAQRISKEKDFSIRAAPASTDELNQLTGSFNEMVAEVQHLQLEQKRAAELLEQAVAERTAQLRDANENLQNFSYSAAHDLRSPLRSISTYASVVLEDFQSNLPAEARGNLERVLASAAHMNQLLTDLLEYSRISKVEMQLAPVHLDRAVADAISLLQAEIRAKEAKVHVQMKLGTVRAHSATLVTVIQNLVSNALKFVPPGGAPEIRISSEINHASVFSGEPRTNGNLANPPSIRLVVVDNGIGVEAVHFSRIFGAFERLHNRQAYPGTGLGLTIVRKAIERMGGEIGLESHPGKGSRFWFELPAA